MDGRLAADIPDFDRQRRRRTLSRIAERLRAEPDDVCEILPLDEVVAALGRRSVIDLGVRAIPLDSIVGTVDRPRGDFDRQFRPRTDRVRSRWEGVAAARTAGVELPPIDVYRVGELHFVEDGHHRVSVSRALGDRVIDAHVREVRTALGAPADLRAGELPLKHHERIFFERVPLRLEQRAGIQLSDEWRYAQLATMIEARGFRESHVRGRLLSREELGQIWFRDHYEPIVAVLQETGVGGPGTDTDRYLRFVMLRDLLLRKQEW